MDEKLLASVVGVATGAAGYFFTTFWMKPVLRYGELRQQVLSDLVFFANAIRSDGLGAEMKQRVLDREVSNRRTSADLIACYLVIPFWYRWYLKLRCHNPIEAAHELIGLSNSREFTNADRHIAAIRSKLGLPDH